MNAAVRQIRREIAEINDDVASMTSTLIRMGEASEWTDPRIDLIERCVRCFERERAMLVTLVKVIEIEQVKTIKRLAAIVSPPTSCPACDAEAGQQSPAGTTSRHCERHLSELQQQVAARHNTAAA